MSRALAASALLGLLLAWPLREARAQEAELTLDALRAADRLRETAAAERARWAEERARLELLVASAEEQTAALRRRAAADRRELEAARAEAPPPPEAVLEALTAAALEVADQIDDGLDRLARELPPGVVPPRAPADRDPRVHLDDALHRLERAERATRSIDVLVTTGELDGAPRSIELLRLGGVAAWWRSLDGEAGGEASMIDGRLRLEPAADPRDVEAIARAAAIAKGRRAPEVVLLPVRRARVDEDAKR